MFLNCFVEFTCISTIIWFVMHYVLNVKFTKRFVIVPIVTFAISFYLLVGKFDEKYIFGTGILYLLLPILLAKDLKKTVVLYTSLLTIVLSYFIFGFIYFIMNFFQIPIAVFFCHLYASSGTFSFCLAFGYEFLISFTKTEYFLNCLLIAALPCVLSFHGNITSPLYI